MAASQGQPFACAHCSTSRCPPSAANLHVCSSHGQPSLRAHCSISRCPPSAACVHVPESHGQPFSRNTFNSSRCSPLAAARQRTSRRDRLPPRCMRCTALKHPSFTALSSSSSLNSSPVATIVSRIARLTAGSRARSAGSSKISGCGRRRGGRGGRGWLLASQQGNSSLVETSAPQRLWS